MSQVIQTPRDRVRTQAKQQLGSRSGRPPLMDSQIGPRSYKEVIKHPVLAWKPKNQLETSRGAHPYTQSKSQLIHRKYTEMLQRSTVVRPICLKCGSPGHMAKFCRNATICFICNKFGHTARECTSITLAFLPTPPLKPPRNPRSIAVRRDAFKAKLRRHPITMGMLLRTPIGTLIRSAESELIEQQFQLSFILNDIAGWGPERVERCLNKRFKQVGHRWFATVYEEFQYMIRAPTKVWLESVTNRGILVLEHIEFPVLPWEPEFDEGMDLKPIWVRIRGFTKFQWNWLELEKVYNPLGAHLLELDPGMGGRYDWRFIRVKLGFAMMTRCVLKTYPIHIRM